jgi:hypothetical protein
MYYGRCIFENEKSVLTAHGLYNLAFWTQQRVSPYVQSGQFWYKKGVCLWTVNPSRGAVFI